MKFKITGIKRRSCNSEVRKTLATLKKINSAIRPASDFSTAKLRNNGTVDDYKVVFFFHRN